jgi:hypothetical protein
MTREDEEFEASLRQSLREQAYSLSFSLEADAIRPRLEHAHTTWRRWLAVALASLAAVVLGAVLFGLASLADGEAVPGVGHASPTGSAELPPEPSATLVTTPTPASTPDLPLYYRDPSTIAGPQALAVGTLELREDGCLGLNRGAYKSTRLLAWPWPGTHWVPETGTIIVNGIAAKVGTEVRLGGGYDGAPAIDDPLWLNPPRPECWQETRFTVVGIESDD